MISERMLNVKLAHLVPYLDKIKVAQDVPANAKPRDIFKGKLSTYDLLTRIMFLSGYYEGKVGASPAPAGRGKLSLGDLLQRADLITKNLSDNHGVDVDPRWYTREDTGFLTRSMTGVFSLLAHEFGAIGAVELVESIVKDTFLQWIGGGGSGSKSENPYASMFGYALSANLNKFRQVGKYFAKKDESLDSPNSLNYAANVISKHYRKTGVDLLRKLYREQSFAVGDESGLKVQHKPHRGDKQKEIAFLEKGLDRVVDQWAQIVQDPRPQAQGQADRLKGQIRQMADRIESLSNNPEYRNRINSLIHTVETLQAQKSVERRKLRKLRQSGYDETTSQFQAQEKIVRDLSIQIQNLVARIGNIKAEEASEESIADLKRQTNVATWSERDVNLFVLSEILTPKEDFNKIQFNEVKVLWKAFREEWRSILLEQAESIKPMGEGNPSNQRFALAWFKSRLIYLRTMIKAVADESKEIREQLSDENLTQSQQDVLRRRVTNQSVKTVKNLKPDELYQRALTEWRRLPDSDFIDDPYLITKYGISDKPSPKRVKRNMMEVLKESMANVKNNYSEVFEAVDQAIHLWQTQGTPGSAQWPGRFASKRLKEIRERRLIRLAMQQK